MEFSEAPVDLEKLRDYRLKRLLLKMEASDVGGLILFNQINTRYATDVTNMQIWCHIMKHVVYLYLLMDM